MTNTDARNETPPQSATLTSVRLDLLNAFRTWQDLDALLEHAQQLTAEQAKQ